MQYGYGRVSTIAQDTALQVDAFKRAGVDRVVTEKWSSIGARPRLRQLLVDLEPGDTVTVYKLDRLGRSLQDLLVILDKIHQAGAAFRSLTEPVDTTTPGGKLMYSVLGAVAEFERSLIRERSIAGQVAALRRGVRIGRPKRLTDEQEWEVIEACFAGESQRSIAARFGVTQDVVKMAWFRVVYPEHPRLAGRRPVLGPLLARGK
jgi:DNA invertase Pin-like site-specific DNA recombinase